MLSPRISRRDFLKAGGSLVVSFTLAGRAAGAAAASPAPPPKSVALDDVDGFLAIDAKGRVTVFSGKVDLGTGVRTALTQIAAEELDVPLASVEIIQGDTALTPDQGPTYGSLSIQNGGMQIRQAAATARQALIAQAADRLKLPREELAVHKGRVHAKYKGRSVTYAQLVGGKAFSLKLDKDAPLKDPVDYSIVGKSAPRLDIPGKVTGRFTYMQDFKLPGMLHARVLRPAALNATLLDAEDAGAKIIPGYVGMVRKGNFLAVVARGEWNAIRASRVVKTSWSAWEGLPEKAKLWEFVRATKINRDDVTQNIGNSAEAVKGGARHLSASYDFAIHTHGSIGPSCAVADFRDGKLTCWSASQQTHLLRKQIAAMLNMQENDVRCIYIDGSGCYGRNGHEDAAADAALLAVELAKPVRVQWMRADEHGWDPKGPPTLIDYRAALDDNGDVVAWESEAYVPDGPKQLAVTLLAADLAGLPKQDAHPGNVHQSLAIPYSFPNVKTVAHRLAATPLRPSWIRTPGRMQNTFGNESFLDELAHAAGADPLEYRLRKLKDARGVELLQRLARIAKWEPRISRPAYTGPVATGRGLAYVKYELVPTYVGAVADVEVNHDNGKIRVTRFTIAHDCGQIINPDGLKNQIEGNVLQTTSRTLIEDVQFDRSMVTSLDWASYPILTFPEAPQVVIELIDRPKEKPWGAGEPTSAVVSAAISNAVFDAVGVRLRSVPFTQIKAMNAILSA